MPSAEPSPLVDARGTCRWAVRRCAVDALPPARYARRSHPGCVPASESITRSPPSSRQANSICVAQGVAGFHLTATCPSVPRLGHGTAASPPVPRQDSSKKSSSSRGRRPAIVSVTTPSLRLDDRLARTRSSQRTVGEHPAVAAVRGQQTLALALREMVETDPCVLRLRWTGCTARAREPGRRGGGARPRGNAWRGSGRASPGSRRHGGAAPAGGTRARSSSVPPARQNTWAAPGSSAAPIVAARASVAARRTSACRACGSRSKAALRAAITSTSGKKHDVRRDEHLDREPVVCCRKRVPRRTRSGARCRHRTGTRRLGARRASGAAPPRAASRAPGSSRPRNPRGPRAGLRKPKGR